MGSEFFLFCFFCCQNPNSGVMVMILSGNRAAVNTSRSPQRFGQKQTTRGRQRQTTVTSHQTRQADVLTHMSRVGKWECFYRVTTSYTYDYNHPAKSNDEHMQVTLNFTCNKHKRHVFTELSLHELNSIILSHLIDSHWLNHITCDT